uniref:Uncharacterized protein n=1 Tax=Anguilla anguilla TaxID=7936 RepID=A0A0E9TEM5_ANGAN
MVSNEWSLTLTVNPNQIKNHFCCQVST